PFPTRRSSDLPSLIRRDASQPTTRKAAYIANTAAMGVIQGSRLNLQALLAEVSARRIYHDRSDALLRILFWRPGVQVRDVPVSDVVCSPIRPHRVGGGAERWRAGHMH